jgi:hypothetical protein
MVARSRRGRYAGRNTRSGWILGLVVGLLVLGASSAQAASYVLTWADTATGESAWQVQRKVEGGSYSQVGSDQAANTTTYTDSTAADGTSYRYRVRAIIGGVGQPFSNEACMPVACSPAAPTNVHATGQTTPAQMALVASVYTPPYGGGGVTGMACTVTVAPTQATVQAAINAASTGATICLTSGSVSWSSMTLNKAVNIQGAGQGVTTINVSGSGTVWTITKQASGPITISNLSLVATTSGTPLPIVIQGSWLNTQPVIFKDITTTNIGASLIDIFVNGGVIFSRINATGDWNDGLFTVKVAADTQSWSTNDSMGMNDADGLKNIYVEDSTLTNMANGLTDHDDGGRVVVRHNTLMNAGYNSHGYDTSAVGLRHFEYYNNDVNYRNSGWPENNLYGGYLWLRGGTGIIYGNNFDDISGDPGTPAEIQLSVRLAQAPSLRGLNCTTGVYPLPRQIGQNWASGTGYFTDPIYIWGNTGTTLSVIGNFSAEWGNECSRSFPSYAVQSGRDYIVGTAKPGWTPYTYPHPYTLPYNSYATSFPLTQNPISESSVWLNGQTNGLVFSNVRTNGTTGTAYSATNSSNFDDATAILKGTWGANQTAQATVFNAGPGSSWAEVELRLRSTLTANSSTGYEAYCSVGTGNPYCKVARWNGPLGSFCNLNSTSSVPVLTTGTVMKATVTGTNPVTITISLNGSPVLTATDNGGTGLGGSDCPGGAHAPFTNGAPGIGFWDNGATLANFGLRNFSATSP